MLKLMRIARVLRPLRAITTIKSTKSLVSTLMDPAVLKKLANVCLLCGYCCAHLCVALVYMTSRQLTLADGGGSRGGVERGDGGARMDAGVGSRQGYQNVTTCRPHAGTISPRALERGEARTATAGGGSGAPLRVHVPAT